MQIAVNDKKIALHFEDPDEATQEIMKLSCNAASFIATEDKIVRLDRIDNILVSVIIEGEYSVVKEGEKT